MTAGSVQRVRKTSRMLDRPSLLLVKAASVFSSSRSRTHCGSNPVPVCAGRVPLGHNKLNDSGLCIVTGRLPADVMRTQPEEDFASGFEVSEQAGGMLHGGMDIPKVPLQPILAVDRVGASSVEHAIDGPDRFVHAVGNRQTGLGDLAARVWHASAHGLPGCPDGLEHIGAGRAEDGFGFGHPRLYQGTIP